MLVPCELIIGFLFMCFLVFEGVIGDRRSIVLSELLLLLLFEVQMYTSMKLAVKIFITCRLRADQYTVFFNVIFLLLCLTRTLFVCLYCYYKNITTNYWGWVVLALVSVCTSHCSALLDLHLCRFPFTYFCTLSHLVYKCISMHQCFVWCVLLPQCLCIVYLCCSAYQNHLSFFTFRILQCCLLHDQCFPQLVSFPAFFQGEWKYC